MNEELQLLRETLEDALGASLPLTTYEPPEGGALAEPIWATARELGWDQVGLPEELGGFGAGTVAPLVALAQAIGRHRVPVPAVESALARWAVAAAGLPTPDDGATLTVAPDADVTLTFDTAHGTLPRVPWGRHASAVVVGGPDGQLAVVTLGGDGAEVRPGTNLAGEARDTIILTGAPAATIAAQHVTAQLAQRATLLRVAQMLGAMEQALAATREHTAARKQFGRPLDRFQMVGGHIAEMAAQTAQVAALLADATRAHDAGAAAAATASLKLVAGEAATVVARSAHQTHGAIGVTREYRLHQFTRRLWAWREELGAERHWSRALGTAALRSTADELWAATTPQAA
jgi:acyl-CoA dehydrogenase